MYEQLLTRFHWLALSNEQRLLMRQLFNIPKSGGVEMMGGRIMSDGSNENDLKAVNIKSMQEFLGGVDEDDTFESLFNRTVAKVDDMIEAEAVARLEAEQAERNFKRHEEVGDIVQSMIDTFNRLPIDAQEKVRTVMREKQKELGQEALESVINHLKETPNVNIKKAGRPKKAEEGSH